VGPLLGGWLIATASWRWVFLINAPVAAFVVYVARRHVPETSDPTVSGGVDFAGAALGVVGLAGLTYALIEAPVRGVGSGFVVVAAVLGVVAFIGFVLVERRKRHPMMPPDIFRSVQFSAGNAVTFAVYAALGGVFFLLTVALQTVVGFSPIAAGSALLPVTGLMLLLSARAGALAQRIGPRLPMSLGPVVCAGGLLLMLGIDSNSGYVADVLPGVVVFGLGLSLLVAPLTAMVLAAADAEHAGVASGVNNAVARAAGLIAVAVLPAAVGLSGHDYTDPAALTSGLHLALVICAVMLVLGGLLAAVTIRNDLVTAPRRRFCGVDGTPLSARSQDEISASADRSRADVELRNGASNAEGAA
jgi:MFS family permease